MVSGATVEAMLLVLWNTRPIRSMYEDRALDADARMWRNNGGLFPNHARYHSQKWKKMMGEDDPNVRGRRVSQSAMLQARNEFE